MERRKFILSSGGIGLIGLSGCISADSLAERTNTFESNTITAPEFILEQTGFDDMSVYSSEKTKSFTYQNESQEITFIDYLTVFENTEMNGIEKIWVHSQPVREVGDKELKAYNYENLHDILNDLDTEWENYSIEMPVQTTDINSMDTELSIDEYVGKIEFEGTEENMMFGFSNFEYEDDEVTIFSITPEEASESFSSVYAVLQLLEYNSYDFD